MMNNKGAGPSLTWILMSLGVFVAIVTLSLNAYNDILYQNNITADSGIMSAYQNITGQDSGLNSIKNGFTVSSFSSFIDAAWKGFYSLVGFGFNAIFGLLSALPIIEGIISVIQTEYPGFAVVFWLGTFIISVYIAARYIKVLRQDAEEA